MSHSSAIVCLRGLGALGNPFRFQNRKQVLKMAGLDLSAIRSGKPRIRRPLHFNSDLPKMTRIKYTVLGIKCNCWIPLAAGRLAAPLTVRPSGHLKPSSPPGDRQVFIAVLSTAMKKEYLCVSESSVRDKFLSGRRLPRGRKRGGVCVRPWQKNKMFSRPSVLYPRSSVLSP